MQPVFYRWDAYVNRKVPTLWRVATPGKLKRAFRAMIMPDERIRIRYDNGQEVVFRRNYKERTKT